MHPDNRTPFFTPKCQPSGLFIALPENKYGILIFISFNPLHGKGVKGVKVETGNVEGWVMKHGEDDPNILSPGIHGSQLANKQ